MITEAVIKVHEEIKDGLIRKYPTARLLVAAIISGEAHDWIAVQIDVAVFSGLLTEAEIIAAVNHPDWRSYWRARAGD